MQRLYQLLVRFHIALFFLLLQVIAFFLLFQNNNFHKTTYINSSSRLTGSIYERVDVVSGYLRLRDINEDLSQEIAILKNSDRESFVKLNKDLVLINDSLFKQKWEYNSARVINKSVNRASNYLTLNKGSKHGIGKGMSVVSGDAIVGIVKDVSDHYASVLPVINSHFQASVKLYASQELGILRWEGHNPYQATVYDIPSHAQIQVGDTIVTTGYSSYFPENKLVGIVAEPTIEEGDNFHTITIDLACNFYQLSHVEIISNLMREEQLTLENLVLEDD